jgi:hypothetical protein
LFRIIALGLPVNVIAVPEVLTVPEVDDALSQLGVPEIE